MDLTVQRVREALIYCPETGVFKRKLRTAQRHQAGDRADFPISGGNAKGYSRVSLDGKRYLAHRVAWLYVHGQWPSQFIDHINGEKSDNRLINLRDVNRIINSQNIRRARKDNSHGNLGISWHKQNKKWCARIGLQGKTKRVGSFSTVEQASEAYLNAKRKLHKGCTI